MSGFQSVLSNKEINQYIPRGLGNFFPPETLPLYLSPSLILSLSLSLSLSLPVSLSLSIYLSKYLSISLRKDQF